MFCRFKFSSLCLMICVCIFLTPAKYFYFNYVNQSSILDKLQYYSENRDGENSRDCPKMTLQSFNDTLLDMTRKMVKIEMRDYNYKHSGVEKLDDLVMESGGSPMRSIIVTTWRSGSSFLGDLINALPASFYSYEPLMVYGTLQIRGPPLADKAVAILTNILSCNYFNNKTDLAKYLTHAKKWEFQFEHNKRFWDICGYKKELCFDADFAGKFCRLLPFHVVKLIRLRLPPLETILEQDQLDVRVVLLVRDPRGVMQSRRYIKLCSNKFPDCTDSGILCYDMATDYKAAVQFLRKYPGRVMMLRYEDLALKLKESTLQLLKFLRLAPTRSVYEFLEAHTNATDLDRFSTIRVTTDVPFKWTKMMHFKDVQNVQAKCKDAMLLWGYKMAHNASHMASKHFEPLLPYRRFLARRRRHGAVWA